MTEYRQARWKVPLIFEISSMGATSHQFPEAEAEIRQSVRKIHTLIPKEMQRKTPPAIPEVSELQVIRHFTRLSQMNFSVSTGTYPLGSCTMKYNPVINDWAANLDGFAWLHPSQDASTSQGALELMWELERWLAEITGMDAVTLQPAAGAQGEYTGVML
ncbi:MAG: aminomethyl-transferring glycine dehydrogenase subunit GcvPB, partial [Promethearchaeota archaeon]